MKYIKVVLKDRFDIEEGSYFCKAEDIQGIDLFDEWDELGTSYTLTVVEMSQEEFEAMPEFQGF